MNIFNIVQKPLHKLTAQDKRDIIDGILGPDSRTPLQSLGATATRPVSMVTTAMQKMVAARESMLTDSPFWGSLALRLRLVEDPTCRTGWTDGSRIGFNPTFVLRLSFAHCVFLVAHEVFHNVLGHPWRRDNRKPVEWNIATDLAINYELQKAGFEIIPGSLLDSQYDGLTAESIYSKYTQGQDEPEPTGTGGDETDESGDSGDEDSDNPGGASSGSDESGDDAPGSGESDEDADEADESEPGNGAGSSDSDSSDNDETDGRGSGGDEDADEDEAAPSPMGEVRDAPEPQESGQDASQGGAQDMSESDWTAAVAEAAIDAQMYGDYGSDLERMVDEILKPRIDWADELMRFAQDAGQSDYSYTQPDVDFIPMDIFMPSLQADGMGHLVIAIDTSGSVTQGDLNQMEAEAREIVDVCDPIRTTVIYCDARINNAETFERGDLVDLKKVGGGGTDFRPVFDYVENELGERPACLIYLTDTQGRFPEHAPEYPVMWAATSRYHRQIPWGELVIVE